MYEQPDKHFLTKKQSIERTAANKRLVLQSGDALPTREHPFIFSQKSAMGYLFGAITENDSLSH